MEAAAPRPSLPELPAVEGAVEEAAAVVSKVPLEGGVAPPGGGQQVAILQLVHVPFREGVLGPTERRDTLPPRL